MVDNPRSSQLALIHHILNGFCASNSNHDCCLLSGSVGLVDLSSAMCNIVVDAPIHLLQLMCKGIGYLSTDSLTEVELLKLIRVCHDVLLKNSSLSINTCLRLISHHGSGQCFRLFSFYSSYRVPTTEYHHTVHRISYSMIRTI